MKSNTWKNKRFRMLLCFILLLISITEPFADKYVKDFAVWRYFLIESTNALTGKKGFELWQVSFFWKEDDNKNPISIDFEVVVTEINKQNGEYKLGRFVIHRFIEGKNKAIRTDNKVILEVGYSHYEMEFNENGMLKNISGGHINPIEADDVSSYQLSNKKLIKINIYGKQ